jgi:hypothetical protein
MFCIIENVRSGVNPVGLLCPGWLPLLVLRLLPLDFTHKL